MIDIYEFHIRHKYALEEKTEHLTKYLVYIFELLGFKNH
jgi:hypothetical protein